MRNVHTNAVTLETLGDYFLNAGCTFETSRAAAVTSVDSSTGIPGVVEVRIDSQCMGISDIKELRKFLKALIADMKAAQE